jgi:hypothetical protein
VTARGRAAAAVAAAVLLLGGAVWRSRRRDRDERPPPPDPAPGHVALLADLARARASGEPFAVAAANARLSGEALAAAERTTRAWMTVRDAGTGLLPRRPDDPPKTRHWNARDVAADAYAHFVNAARVVAPDLEPALREILETERRLCPGLPCRVDFATGRRASETLDERVFGAVEYAKDGLLSVLEANGETPWRARLEEVVEAVAAEGVTATRAGKVVSDRAEKNGEILQVLARLWRRTGDERRRALARGIADAYLVEVFPKTGDLPPKRWDFAAGKAIDATVSLRDHGNEVVAGLVEWALVDPEVRPGVERMLDRLLEVGRGADGLWRNRAAASPAQAAERERGGRNDNWGYVSCAFLAYARALPEGDPRRARYEDAARGSLRAAAALEDARWEGGFDGWCDTIEGGLYLLAFLEEPRAADWVDAETGRLLAFQRPDGFVGRHYLDGNFVRTCLLYGLWKSAGVRAVPWREDVSVGVHRTDAGWHLVLRAERPWKGLLRFDGPRHEETLRLPADYPRLNSWPEWLVVRAGEEVRLEEDADPVRSVVVRAEALRAGLPAEIVGASGGERRWRVSFP